MAVAVDPPVPRLGEVSFTRRRDDEFAPIDTVARAESIRAFQTNFPDSDQSGIVVNAESLDTRMRISELYLGGARLHLEPSNGVEIVPCPGRDLCCRLIGDDGHGTEMHVVTVDGSLATEGEP